MQDFASWQKPRPYRTGFVLGSVGHEYRVRFVSLVDKSHIEANLRHLSLGMLAASQYASSEIHEGDRVFRIYPTLLVEIKELDLFGKVHFLKKSIYLGKFTF